MNNYNNITPGTLFRIDSDNSFAIVIKTSDKKLPAHKKLYHVFFLSTEQDESAENTEFSFYKHDTILVTHEKNRL
jgi:hypothetical protein